MFLQPLLMIRILQGMVRADPLKYVLLKFYFKIEYFLIMLPDIGNHFLFGILFLIN